VDIAASRRAAYARSENDIVTALRPLLDRLAVTMKARDRSFHDLQMSAKQAQRSANAYRAGITALRDAHREGGCLALVRDRSRPVCDESLQHALSEFRARHGADIGGLVGAVAWIPRTESSTCQFFVGTFSPRDLPKKRHLCDVWVHAFL